MTQQVSLSPKSGRLVLVLFLTFFAIFGLVDAYFVYKAIHTNTGVITEQAYEKGLAYSTVIEKARQQPNLTDNVSYQNGTFVWQAKSPTGQALENATVRVKFIRPIQEGYDFEASLHKADNGIYTTDVNFPMKGLWQAQISARWNNDHYQTSHKFIVQ